MPSHNNAGVREGTFAGMSQAKRKKWRCRGCRDEESNVSVAGSPGSSSEVFLTELASVNEKLDQLLSMRVKVDSLAQLPAKVDALLALGPVVEELKKSVSDLQVSVEFFSGK